MTAGQAAVSDGTMPCPAPHPDGADAPCIKKIPKGWTADEGHAGGHMWMSAATADLLERDHFNARDALSGLPFGPHDPADCHPYCPRYWDDADRRVAERMQGRGGVR